LARIRQLRESILDHHARCIEDIRIRLATGRHPDAAGGESETLQYQALEADLRPLDRYMRRALSRRRSAIRRMQSAINLIAPTRRRSDDNFGRTNPICSLSSLLITS
jgi:hypothetical protein